MLQDNSFLFYECSKASAPDERMDPEFSLLDTAIKAIQYAAPDKFKAIQDAETHTFLSEKDISTIQSSSQTEESPTDLSA